MSFNPIDHIKSAWTGTSTIYGKIAVVCFYLFIWFQILWGIVLVFNPRFGFDCIYEGVPDVSAYFMDSIMVALNLFSFGYFAFAHYYGINVWNILGFFLLGVGTLINNSVFLSRISGENDECAESMTAMLVSTNWMFLPLFVGVGICTYVESKMTPSTVSEETPML